MLALAAAFLAAADTDAPVDSVREEVRVVLEPLRSEPDQVYWALCYAVVLGARTIDLLWGEVPAKKRADTDSMVRAIALSIMAATEEQRRGG
jgi:hypothetical protein